MYRYYRERGEPTMYVSLRLPVSSVFFFLVCISFPRALVLWCHVTGSVTYALLFRYSFVDTTCTLSLPEIVVPVDSDTIRYR